MKKVLLILTLFILLGTGCSGSQSTPVLEQPESRLVENAQAEQIQELKDQIEQLNEELMDQREKAGHSSTINSNILRNQFEIEEKQLMDEMQDIFNSYVLNTPVPRINCPALAKDGMLSKTIGEERFVAESQQLDRKYGFNSVVADNWFILYEEFCEK